MNSEELMCKHFIPRTEGNECTCTSTLVLVYVQLVHATKLSNHV